MKNGQAREPDQGAAGAMEREFQQRVQYVAGLDEAYRDCRRRLAQLEKAKR